MDKSILLDTSGRPLTQSLFLEIGYNDCAVYTLKDNDHIYKGKKFPSIKRKYLELEDTTEYEFANMYFLGWQHWMRICENKTLAKYILNWREELELKLRARAVKQMVVLAEGGSFQASKWLADKGYDKRDPGRPSKDEKDMHTKIQDDLHDQYKADVVRLKEIS